MDKSASEEEEELIESDVESDLSITVLPATFMRGFQWGQAGGEILQYRSPIGLWIYHANEISRNLSTLSVPRTPK